MKLLSTAFWIGWGTALLAQAALAGPASGSAAPLKFQFNFELDHPLVYTVDSKVKSVTERTMQLDTGHNSAVTANSVETRYKMTLTPVRKSADGIWTVHYQPTGFEQDLEVDGGAGHVKTTLRGLEVKSTQNAITVVDSTKNIGVSQAKALKQAVYTKMLGGYFDFKPTGEIAKVDGDLPFIDYWTDAVKYQVGFFDLLFPSNPVPPGGNWSANLTLKNLEGLKLGDEGVLETNLFVRNPASAASAHLESIGVTMSANVRDITGSADAMGQNSMLNIPQFNHSKTGKFQFDSTQGCLVKAAEDELFKTTMDALVQGHTVTMKLDLQTSTKIELLKN